MYKCINKCINKIKRSRCLMSLIYSKMMTLFCRLRDFSISYPCLVGVL